MPPHDDPPADSPGSLRVRAEAVAFASPQETRHMSPEDIDRLVHELEVHQIELRMQNEELMNTQLELAKSRDRFMDLYDFAPVGYLTMDSDTTIREANITAAELLGVHRAQLSGQRLTRFVVSQCQDALFLLQQSLLDSGTKQTCELVLRRANGTTFHAQLDGSPDSVGFRCVIVDITQRKLMENALLELTTKLEERVQQRTAELAHANLRLSSELVERESLERQIATIAENERHRIGLDLHDGIAQILTGLRFNSEVLAIRAAKTDPEIGNDIRSIASRLGEAIEEARAIARGLQPVEPIPEGLAVALQQLADSTSQLCNVECRFTIHGPGLVPDHLAATHLYRIAQEAVNNAIKHGNANSIRISLRDRPGKLTLSIVNDGGKPLQPTCHRSLGIKSMNHRAQRIGARFECRSHHAGGTLVRCLLSLKAPTSVDSEPSDPHESINWNWYH